MKVFYTYSPEKNPAPFVKSVQEFSPNLEHDLVILCSTDSEPQAKAMGAELFEYFDGVEVIAKSYASPKKSSEYNYFESRIISALYVKFPNLGPALFLGRDDLPTADGWCNTINNLILSSGKPLTGYGKPYRGGVLYADSLLTNGFFKAFDMPKFTHSSTYMRAGMRFEAFNLGSVLTDDLIPLTGKPAVLTPEEIIQLEASRANAAETKKKSTITRVAAKTAHEIARNGASRREPNARSMVQPKPPEGTVTTFGRTFAENEKIPFPEVVDLPAPAEVEATTVEAPEESTPTVETEAPPKPPTKIAKKQAAKQARKAPAKKAAKKSK